MAMIRRQIWTLDEDFELREDYPSSWDKEEFKNLNSYAARKRYADQHLQKVGSGSARHVYIIDNEKVLKLAANNKGLDQNYDEASISRSNWHEDIVAKVFDSHPDNLWIESELARKITPKRFQQLTGFSIDDVGRFLFQYNQERNGRKVYSKVSDELYENMINSEFISDILYVVDNWNMQTGDWGSISSYGEVKRNGQPQVVLIDYGLTQDTFEKHYDKSKRNRYQGMYEGNILEKIHSDVERYGLEKAITENINEIMTQQDLENGVQDTHGEPPHRGGYDGFALLPDSISQADYNSEVNEALNDFRNVGKDIIAKAMRNIKAFDPSKLADLYGKNDFESIYKSYMVAIQNLEEILSASGDEPNFFNKILKVQEFLKDSDIINEDLVYNHADDASPENDKYSLSEYEQIVVNKFRPETLNNLAVKVAHKMGYTTPPKFLGTGENGYAYDLGDGKVLKITGSEAEATESSIMKGKNSPHLAQIYDVKRIDYDEDTVLYLILQEKINTSSSDRIEKFIGELDNALKKEIMQDMEGVLAEYYSDPYVYDVAYKPHVEEILNEVSPEAKNFFYQMMAIISEVKKYGLDTIDFFEPTNLGYKGDNLAFFDFGGRYDKPLGKRKVKQFNIDEGGDTLYMTQYGARDEDFKDDVNEDVMYFDRDIADYVAHYIAYKMNFEQPKFLSHGSFGYAYDLGNSILKVTADSSEAFQAAKIKGVENPRIAQIFNVWETDRDSSEITKNRLVYAIHQEKLDTSIYNSLSDNLSTLTDVLFDNGYSITNVIHNNARFNTAEWKEIYKPNVDELLKDKPELLNLFNELVEIAKETKKLGIDTGEYLSVANLGLKNGKLAFFDVGLSTAKKGHNVQKMEINERITTWMPKAKSVKVKKKCTINGNGDGTSQACDQGDIENIQLDDINDDNKNRRKDNTTNVAEVDEKNRYYFEQIIKEELEKKSLNELMKSDFELPPFKVKDYDLILNGKVVGTVYISERPINDYKAHYDLSEIKVHPEFRGEKIFTRFMLSLIKHANKNNIVISLTPEAMGKGGVSTSKLKQVYSALGFKKNSGSNRNFEVSNSYIKIPEDSLINENMITETTLNIQELPFRDELEKMGGKLYSVGGAVRDELLGKQSDDLDIVVTGVPMEQLKDMLSKYGSANLVGNAFGIINFKPKGSTEDIDIALPRTETPTGGGGYTDFDVQVDHTLSIEDDLKRRDLSINAIAKDIDGNIIDPFGGRNDLANKVIRMASAESFGDDPLRMLRAIRFAARFSFTIEPETEKIIKQNAGNITKIPKERFLKEFTKMYEGGGDPLYFVDLLRETGLYEAIFGQLPAGTESWWDVEQWDNIKSFGDFMFMLLKPLGNPAEVYMNSLKGDSDTMEYIDALDYAWKHNPIKPFDARVVGMVVNKKSPSALQSGVLPKNGISDAVQEFATGMYPKSYKELAVNGYDLMQLGLKGKQVGDALTMILKKIYSDEVKNEKNEIIQFFN